MMKVLMINGSPKAQNSNSGYVLELMRKRLPNDWECTAFQVMKPGAYGAALAAVAACDMILFSFPLYVDCLPSHLLGFITEAGPLLKRRDGDKPIRIYAVINCGFFEGCQNQLALEIIQHWTARVGAAWGQAVITGGGEMLGKTKNVPMGHGPNKNIHRALGKLADTMARRASGADICINPSFSRPLFIFGANRMWRYTARKNGLKRRNLYDQ